ncbi:MAG: type II toxin-antitoxin system RelE/ParE family toxin [Alphaproteobacteria bacterium]|nr:type II toxin-antitoxin system RelE/ParE family toxin [Alphaproteobacteria bacterium]
MRVVWASPAILDLERHAAYLDLVNPAAARELAITLVTVTDSLTSMPHRGRPGRVEGTRELNGKLLK